MRFLIFAGLLAACGLALGQQSTDGAAVDSDHDGISDAQEQALLDQFAPRFMISRDDCSNHPAEFAASHATPVVAVENSTIYAQAFRRTGREEQIELHYYDLWRKDCGQRGHNLDAEHVSALLERDATGAWKARYWYAAAHEDTLCDASQLARAVALDAETHGPELWISSGKHAAFLGQKICSRGCGADRCSDEERLSISNLVNVGEPSAPMNGAVWVNSAEWPLGDKLRRSDFSDARLARADRSDLVWANPGKRPAQAAILGGDDAVAGVGMALTTADADTDAALDTAEGKTGNALARAYRGVKNALRASVRTVEGK